MPDDAAIIPQLLTELARDVYCYCECPPGELLTIPEDGEPEIIVAHCLAGPWSIGLLTSVSARVQSLTVIPGLFQSPPLPRMAGFA